MRHGDGQRSGHKVYGGKSHSRADQGAGYHDSPHRIGIAQYGRCRGGVPHGPGAGASFTGDRGWQVVRNGQRGGSGRKGGAHTREELTAIIEELVSKLDDHELLVYFQVSRGTQMRNHAPAKDLIGNIWITIKPAKLRDCYTPMKLITFPDTRYFHCNMKTLNLLPSVLASRAADEAGADEAIFHRGEIVTECAHSNISIIKNKKLITAPADNMILAGVARAHLLRTCDEIGIECEQRHYTLSELMDADEIIVTASGTLCRPACEVDGIAVGGKDAELVSLLREKIIDDFIAKTNI